jgi:hypothetical protein
MLGLCIIMMTDICQITTHQPLGDLSIKGYHMKLKKISGSMLNYICAIIPLTFYATLVFIIKDRFQHIDNLIIFSIIIFLLFSLIQLLRLLMLKQNYYHLYLDKEGNIYINKKLVDESDINEIIHDEKQIGRLSIDYIKIDLNNAIKGIKETGYLYFIDRYTILNALCFPIKLKSDIASKLRKACSNSALIIKENSLF